MRMTTLGKADKDSYLKSESLNNVEPQDYEIGNNTFEEMEKRVDNMFKKINESLGQTSLMIFNLGISQPGRPDIYKELSELKSEYSNLKKELDGNNKEVKWESISNFLWKMIAIVSNYGNDKEKSIIVGVEECLQELQQIRSQAQKIKDLHDISVCFEKNFAENCLNIPLYDNFGDSNYGNNVQQPTKPNTGLNFSRSDYA